MSHERRNTIVCIGALVSIVLHVAVAPAITFFAVPPNFLLCYILVVAIVNPGESGLLLPFTLGLVYDLTGTGLVGSMTILFIVSSFIVSNIFLILDNDTVFTSLLVLIGSFFMVEMLYGAIQIWSGLSVGLMDAFLYRALPCALYDSIVGLALFPLMSKLLVGVSQNHGLRTPQLR